MSDLRLYLFECGTLKCKLHNIKMNQGLNEPYEIPVPWFFIRHPKGNIVIDGGNALECANDPHAYWGGITDVYFPTMTEQQGCVNELERLKIDPESVSYVLFSHLHLLITRAPPAAFLTQSTSSNARSTSTPSRPIGLRSAAMSGKISIDRACAGISSRDR